MGQDISSWVEELAKAEKAQEICIACGARVEGYEKNGTCASCRMEFFKAYKATNKSSTLVAWAQRERIRRMILGLKL